MNVLSVSMRPKSLDDLVGSKGVADAIRKTLAEKSPIAFLLSGSTGTGKTTIALILARMVQGEVPPDAVLDIEEINASDNNGVDFVRDLARRAEYRPLSGRRKIIILNEAHRLTEPAQDTLLVPLESPDSTTTWVLTTTDPAKIRPALKRRCLSFDLKPLDKKGVTDLLGRVAGDRDTAPLVDALWTSDITSPGLVLNAAEKWLAGMPPEKAIQGLGDVHEPLYADIAKAVLHGDWPKTSQMLTEIKTADVRGLRACVAAFMRGALVKSPASPRADALAEALAQMCLYGTFEDGLTYGSTVAVLYRTCRKLKGL